MSCHLIFKFKSIDRWQHRAQSLNSKKTATLTCFHSFEDVDANFIQMSRFCVGDRFYLCDNRILCQYDYEERIIFANLAPPNGAPPQPVSIRSFSFKSPSGGTLPFSPFFSNENSLKQWPLISEFVHLSQRRMRRTPNVAHSLTGTRGIRPK